MIEVDNVTKFFGPVLAVDHVSFQVAKGEVVGFLGLNGAGKTTTMRILTTYLPATSGVAKVANHDVMNESLAVRQNIGYLPESVPLYPEMRVEEYLTFRAKLKGVERTERPRRIDYALERCRIREVRRRLIGTLSRGYRQRVGMADALVHKPPILILDEPTSGLDPIQRRETLHTISELRDEHTIMLSTHILPDVETVCQRVIIINRGRIGVDGKVQDLISEQAVVETVVRGPLEQVSNALRSMDGVSRVECRPIEDGLAAYDVYTKGSDDLREVLFQRVAKNGWTMRRLDMKRRTLDEHFQQVVVNETGRGNSD
jgi:ABC-2 type transport system ATP-binding protein